MHLIKLYQIKIHYSQAGNSQTRKIFKKKSKKAEFLNFMNIFLKVVIFLLYFLIIGVSRWCSEVWIVHILKWLMLHKLLYL